MRRIALASLLLAPGLCQAQYPANAYQYPAYQYPSYPSYQYAAYQYPAAQYYPAYQQPQPAYQYQPVPGQYQQPAYQYQQPAPQDQQTPRYLPPSVQQQPAPQPQPVPQQPSAPPPMPNSHPLTPVPDMPVFDDSAPQASAEPTIFPSTVDGESRRFLQSDRAFSGFVGPISSPTLTKDPRSLTEARGLFVNNWFPEHNTILGGGDIQIYGMQLRAALTDRLTLIADKDGYASLSAHNLPHQNGWLDINAGFKYLLVRDVENQFLVSVGATYEPPTGESKVFQHQGSGVATDFGTVGKEFGDFHVLLNGGYQFGLKDGNNSSFFYSQIHLDRRVAGWLYPLVECNFFNYTAGGRNLPAALGEGDSLINFGTNGSAGNTLVTVAAGLKAQVCPNLDVGVAYESPLGRKDVIRDRVLVEMIFRY